LQLQEAYEVLSDPQKRNNYDLKRSSQPLSRVDLLREQLHYIEETLKRYSKNKEEFEEKLRGVLAARESMIQANLVASEKRRKMDDEAKRRAKRSFLFRFLFSSKKQEDQWLERMRVCEREVKEIAAALHQLNLEVHDLNGNIKADQSNIDRWSNKKIWATEDLKSASPGC
jgi:DnaJ-class molecular chaperone